MGRASLTIAVSGEYNGRAMEKARNDLKKMKVTAAAEMGGVAGSFVRGGAAVAELGGKIYNAGEKMESVGSAATKYVSLPIAAAAVACGKAAVDIDTALTGVRKTVDGTEEQYQGLKQAAVEFSKTNAVSASQILDIQALGAQLGFTIDELDEFGRVTSGLDIATNMNAEQAGTEMAQFANITKMAHSEVSNYASAIVGLGNTSATTESDISSMAMRIAAAGTQVGMSQADILGVSAALASMGVEAEAGGTAISTIMANIDKSVAKGSDALKGWADQAGMSTEEFTSAMASNANQFQSLADSAGMTVKELSKEVLDNSDALSTWASTAGMSADEFSTAWKNDPVQALASVFSGMESATEAGGNMSLMLEDLGIDSIRQTDIMKRLAGNSELVTKSVATANDEWEKNTALQNEVDNRNESMAARFEMLQNKVTAVAESVGTPLVNAALEFVDAAEPVIAAVGDAAEAFADMDEQDQRMIVGIVAAAAAFGPVVTVLGKVTKGFGSLVIGVGKGMQGLGTFASGANGAASAVSKLEAGAKAGAGATEGIGKAASTAASGTGLLAKGVSLLNGACKATAIGLAIGLITDLAGQLVAYAGHQQTVADATTGLTDAMGAAEAAYQSYTPNVEAATEAMGDAAISAEDCLRSQSDLAKTMNDTWSDYGTNAAMVDSYVQTIQELGEKGDLTAVEQERLKAAVEGFNDATGSSVGIINGQTGELSMQKDAILEVAEAYKTEARAEAARELYKETTKQLIQDQISLKQATDELAASEEGWGIWLGDFPLVADEASVKHHELQKNVDDLTAATDSAAKTQSDLLNVMAGSQASFDTLDQALEATGISMSDFGDVGEAELQGLQQNFDGTLNSIVSECSAKGIQIPTALADSIRNNSGLPTDAQQVMFDAMVLQMAGGDVELAAQALGHDIDQGLTDGITGNGDMPKEAIGVLSQETIDKAKEAWESHSPSQVMYRLGGDIDAGLGNGIGENSSGPTTAMDSLASLMQNAISGLPGFSQDTGSSSGSNLASSIGGFVGSVASSATSLFNSATGGISGTPSAFSTTGADAAAGLSRSIGGMAGGVATSARSLHSSATGGIAGTAGAFMSTGSAAAGGFSGAIGNASAYGSGRSLANTASSGLGSVSARGAGSNFAQGFANGMGGVNIWSAAYNVGMSALGAIKSALGIASPSREAATVGEYFGEGAIVGMKRTERGIEAEAARMSDAMTLNPPAVSGGKYPAGGAAVREGLQGGRQIVFNVSINVTASDARQAATVGKSVANQLYTEFARRERNCK